MNPPIQAKIPSTQHTHILPKGTALILEGGGIRGFYSAGVFEAFMDHGIMFPYIIGVSAGISNALTYVAGQRMRNRQVVEHCVGSKRYLSKRNMIKHGSMFGYDFIFNEIPQKYVPWDIDAFENVDIQFLTGATDCHTGETVWFGKECVDVELAVAKASCALPIMSPIFKYGDYKLLDGGIVAPIPIEKSIADGNNFHVVVLTRNAGYIKEPFSHKGILKLIYRKYPKLIEALVTRHEAYNRQLAICEQLERDGKAIIIRPIKPLEVSRTGRDIPKLLDLYDEGHREGNEAVERFKHLILL